MIFVGEKILLKNVNKNFKKRTRHEGLTYRIK
jgi:hypothetical protein